jgi:hypothetical protein
LHTAHSSARSGRLGHLKHIGQIQVIDLAPPAAFESHAHQRGGVLLRIGGQVEYVVERGDSLARKGIHHGEYCI